MSSVRCVGWGLGIFIRLLSLAFVLVVSSLILWLIALNTVYRLTYWLWLIALNTVYRLTYWLWLIALNTVYRLAYWLWLWSLAATQSIYCRLVEKAHASSFGSSILTCCLLWRR